MLPVLSGSGRVTLHLCRKRGSTLMGTAVAAGAGWSPSAEVGRRSQDQTGVPFRGDLGPAGWCCT